MNRKSVRKNKRKKRRVVYLLLVASTLSTGATVQSPEMVALSHVQGDENSSPSRIKQLLKNVRVRHPPS